MLTSLDTHLALALIAQKTDKAARKKTILKLMRKVEPQLKRPLIDTVLDSKQPVQTIFDNIGWFLEQESVAREVSGYGCVGMAIHGDVVYPIQAIPSSEYERAWMLSNEEILAKTAATLLAKDLDLDGDSVTVAFLSNRGFSGSRYRVVANKELN